MPKQELSAFEKKRQANIRRNQEQLQKLQLSQLVASTGIGAKPKKRKPTHRSSRAAASQPAKPKKPRPPARRSLRAKGLAPDGVTAAHVAHEQLKVELSKPKWERKEGPVSFEDASQHTEPEDCKTFVNSLAKWYRADSNALKKTRGKAKDATTMAALQDPRWATSEDAQGMVVPVAGVKVTRKRIVSMRFYPGSTSKRSLVCAGDTRGCIGLLELGPIKSAASEDREANVHRFQAHASPVSDLHYAPWDSTQLFSSSYDGSVRVMDLEKLEFSQVIASDEDDGVYQYTSMSFGAHNALYCVTNKGQLHAVDPRARNETVAADQMKQIHDKKIGCVDVNPFNKHQLATASNDRTAAIWDVRKIKGPRSYVTSFAHDLSCSSAYFSPNGCMLATTSYDDCVRIWECSKDRNKWTANSAIHPKKWPRVARLKHNNQTGRWVTNFRARWLSNTGLVIGNMSRRVDIYTMNRGSGTKAKALQPYLTSLQNDHVTAIPAVYAVHPCIDTTMFASGNASGYIHTFC